MTLIEILGADSGRLRVAFYYPVPANMQTPGAIDPSRIPQGTSLSATEISQIQNGVRYEYITEIPLPEDITLAQLKNLIEAKRGELQGDAANEYRSRYGLERYVGKHFDGTNWS